VKPLPTGESGWVFVGSLSRAAEDSEWNSLYILNASDGEKPDKTEKFTLARLRDRIASGGGPATFTADFPLILREHSNSPSGSNLPVVRAGQQFQVLEVAMGGESGKSVMARVKIL
jgi:hypothetical protein